MQAEGQASDDGFDGSTQRVRPQASCDGMAWCGNVTHCRSLSRYIVYHGRTGQALEGWVLSGARSTDMGRGSPDRCAARSGVASSGHRTMEELHS